MSFPRSMSLIRHFTLLGSLACIAAGFASAQSSSSQDSSNAADAADSSSPSGSASSLDSLRAAGFELTDFDSTGSARAEGAGAGQYGSSGGGGEKHGFLHQRQYTFEAGGGFNAPIGNDTNQYGVVSTTSGAPEGVPVITFGGNFTLGGGLRLNDRFSLLAEYQFMDNKLPGALISDVNNATGGADDISSGNTHINSITGSPVIDLFPKKSNGAYLVGGFGWYHKSTNFQAPEAVISYYGEYYENFTVASFTSNQWGANAGFGLYHRLGGSMYGGDSHTQLFAEARYLFIHTPPPTAANGLGTTELIPVTIGVRF
jgi:hypothetical protein